MRQLVCILIALAIAGTYADEPEKLVSGTATSIEQNPHCVSIRVDNKHICGGSIIGDDFVLTAAHCLDGFIKGEVPLGRVTVVTGTTWLTSGGQVHKVARVINHPGYNAQVSYGNDIGIMKLQSKVLFNGKQMMVGLPKTNVARSESVKVVAWGSTGFRQGLHNNLQKIEASIMLPDECQARHQNSMRIYNTEFCTLITFGKGTCNGDSGSGVIRIKDNAIVGVVSRGRPCAQGFPDVYTSVSPYLPWIKQVLATL